MATHTDITDGTRVDVTVEFLSRRPVDCQGERVTRLLVADADGTHFPVLVTPESESYPDLETGETYFLSGLLGADPVREPGDETPETPDTPDTSETHDSPDCPTCGAPLRRGRAIDAAGQVVRMAASHLGIEDTLGILDERASLSPVSGGDDEGIDDWRPMRNRSGRRGPGERRVTGPDFVCDSCAREVGAREVRGHDRDGLDEIVDQTVMESAPVDSTMAASETVGLAAGGAKDVANFRENVAEGYTPQPEAISDEGLFYDYHFETGETEPDADTDADANADADAGANADADAGANADSDASADAGADALFSPRFATAVSDDPLTGETEHYLSVGLDSTLAVEDFQRPRLDLVAVLDVSGSMDGTFDAYYYDEHGRRREAEEDGESDDERERQDEAATKLEAATRSLCALTEQLRPEDRLGVVLFNNRAHVAKPIREVGTTDMPAIRRHVREISAGGGTNMADGFEAALDMLLDEEPDHQTDSSGRSGAADLAERRVVFMTDMMPNTGETGENELTRRFADAATAGVHTTFVGMGLDANAALADTLSGIRGANHYFVHSASEFERRLGDEFDYMVTPLVYDLGLDLDVAADGIEVEAVHGSPTADADAGRLVDVGTLFPSAKDDGEARGGVVLVRLDRQGDGGDRQVGGDPQADVDPQAGGESDGDADLSLRVSWTERDGGEYTETVDVTLPDDPETFAHDGVRKAVVLSRYARALRRWAADVHQRADGATGVDDWLLPEDRGQHERESVPLVVPERYLDDFQRLRWYLEAELDRLGDETLAREVDLLTTLCEQAPRTVTGGGVRADE